MTEDLELAIRIARLEHKLMRRLEKRQFYTERVERTRRQLAELHEAYAVMAQTCPAQFVKCPLCGGKYRPRGGLSNHVTMTHHRDLTRAEREAVEPWTE